MNGFFNEFLPIHPSLLIFRTSISQLLIHYFMIVAEWLPSDQISSRFPGLFLHNFVNKDRMAVRKKPVVCRVSQPHLQGTYITWVSLELAIGWNDVLSSMSSRFCFVGAKYSWGIPKFVMIWRNLRHIVTFIKIAAANQINILPVLIAILMTESFQIVGI